MSATKPERRKSQLAGRNPLRQAPSTPTPPAAVPKPAEPANDAAARSTKIAYYATQEENGRIRAAFLAGSARYGWRSMTEFQIETLMARVEELEAELNGGKPFDVVPPGHARRGRPAG